MPCDICLLPEAYENIRSRSEAARKVYDERKKELGALAFQRLDTPSDIEKQKSVADYVQDLGRVAMVEEALSDALKKAEDIDCTTKDVIRMDMCPRLLLLNYQVDLARRTDPGLDDVL